MDKGMKNLVHVIASAHLAEALWDLTLEGMADGELDKLTSVDKAFKAGVMSAMAWMNVADKLTETASRN